MSIKAGIGLSNDTNAYQAGYEACKLAMQRAGTDRPDFTIAFSSVFLDQTEVVRGIREANQKMPLIGCSDAGEITNEGPSQKSVAVMVVTSDVITFTTGIGRDIKSGAREAGQAAARSVKGATKDPLRLFLMLPDVLAGNGAAIVRGVLDELGAHFPLVGGAAGDDFQFEKTYQYRDDEVTAGSVVGAGLSGTFTMGMGVQHGWIPIGIPMKVTKSKDAVIYELNNKPAVSIYEEYFGEAAKDLHKEPLARLAITYPLGLKVPDSDEYLIRDPITVDENGAITCAAEIPEGSEIRLMIGSKEKAVEAAQEAARTLMSEFERSHSRPKLLLMFNCIAREKLFAQKAKDEIRAVMEIIGHEVPLLGFYTYGEQAPLGGETRDPAKIKPRFFNETIVLCALGE